MNLYLDDNSTDKSLAGLLRKVGHTVVIPADVGLSKRSDACHQEYAVANGLVMLTADCDDFDELHKLVLTAGGSHPGILIVRYDNDPTRDMKPKHIVTAIRKLEQAGVDPRDQLIILNQWR